MKTGEPALLKASYRLYTETLAHSCAGAEAHPGAARDLARVLREGAPKAALEAVFRVFRGVDMTAAAIAVRAPTLVMQRREVAVMDPRAGIRLAQLIPNARFSMVEGDSIAPFYGATEPVLEALIDFLPATARARAPGTPAEPGLRIILFTDLEGHSEMMGRLGDDLGRSVLREHERISREALAASGGQEVKSMGEVLVLGRAMTGLREARLAVREGVAVDRPAGPA